MRTPIAIATVMIAAVGNSCSLEDHAGAREIDRVEALPRPRPVSNNAVTAVIADESGVRFPGGSDEPCDCDDIGCDGGASQPVSGMFGRDFERNEWFEFGIAGQPTMDRRGLVVYRESLVTIGGMRRDQEVADAVYGGGEE